MEESIGMYYRDGVLSLLRGKNRVALLDGDDHDSGGQKR